MKKIYLLFVLFGSITAIAQEDKHDNGCNTDKPGWGDSLGEVSFVSNQTWKVGDLTWSDVVAATNCQKETFDGGSSNSRKPKFKADCRKNTKPKYGDLFSWCAIDRFSEQLCPQGWHVPTTSDFMELAKTLGGRLNMGDPGASDTYMYSNGYITEGVMQIPNYIAYDDDYFPFPKWGGVNNGFCNSRGDLANQGALARYWSQSEIDRSSGISIGFNQSGGISIPTSQLVVPNKYWGMAVRCVRYDL